MLGPVVEQGQTGLVIQDLLGLQNLKQRVGDLWIFGEVRIHLDEVKDLGCFIEFEAVVSRRFNVKACHEAVARLREAFTPLLGEPISVSYSDLMQMQLADAA